ncbi:MAG: hypothetical protein JXB47_04605 [Anaerolineae bacterium]|nr:hypothetical protein [Anaerolineae bacterium]
MKHLKIASLIGFILLLAATACEPLVPTAAYIIISATPPPPTATYTPSITPMPTITPTPTATGLPTETPTPTPQPCNETQGFILQTSFYSSIAGAEVPYRMYFPPCYVQTQRRYPYVILLHGLEGQGQPTYTGQQWLDLQAPEALERGLVLNHLPPMVLVIPDGGRTARLNNFDPDGSYESIIVEDLIPTIESDSSGNCLWTAREGRVIAGISRGGFWAFEIAFRHPELFSAVAGHSPFFDTSVPDAYNPIYMASNLPAEYLSSLRIWADHGADDYVKNTVRTFSDALSERAIPHDYIVNPTGEHEDAYWAEHMTEYLAFYSAQWPKDAYQLPSCKEPIGDSR